MSTPTVPHPSPSDPNEHLNEFPFPDLGNRQSLERQVTADAHQYEADLHPPVPPAAEPPSEPHDEPPIEPRLRSLKVRFRSISHLADRPRTPASHDASESSDPSHYPLLPPPGLENIPLSGTVTPPAPAHSRRSSNPEHASEGVSEKGADVERISSVSSARNRFRNAGQIIRQKTVRLGERLGRPADEGEALNATLIPDDFDSGAIHGLSLEEIQARNARNDANHLRALEEGEEPHEAPPSAEAHRLVRHMTMAHERKRKPRGAYQRSGHTTPEGLLRDFKARRRSSGLGVGGSGILSQLLKLHAVQTGSSSRPESVITDDSDSETQVSSGTPSGATTPKKGSLSPLIPPSMPASGAATPRKEKIKWYKKNAHRSTSSLVNASMNLSTPTLPEAAELASGGKRARRSKRKTRLEDEIRVTEYMQMTARVLEVSGQFLYLPGCMIMSFDDPVTRTAEVKLVRTVQGVDLGRLADVHNVYKNVVHDLIGVEEASQELDDIMQRKPRFNKWLVVLLYGLASAAVGPFAFSARPVDMPIIFMLGSLVGLMQHVLSPRSVLYSNVFEVTAAILTSFLARAFGSIQITRHGHKEYLFCFSALAQSSIALILPGFTVLCSSLELQSHQMIAGSIRLVYAIIYSLFLGYGITVGLTIYGLMDGNASSDTTCPNLDVYGSVYVQKFPFVAIYAFFLSLVNQAKWKQMPVMILFAVCGYITNYFSTTKFGSQSEVANTVGAFTIGVLANFYSRLWHGQAAPAILPGIFVLVPSGLASSGSLLSGLQYANEVRHNLHTSGNSTDMTSLTDGSVASLGIGMIQVAIGITVGLFISALIVYPYGKKRTGLFNF
ncbi:hypothetical protein N7470_001034 [Penicillium chermesinum]|nr:hypothetical protein N7470_001034 [Penicillium chermesinum]